MSSNNLYIYVYTYINDLYKCGYNCYTSVILMGRQHVQNELCVLLMVLQPPDLLQD